MTSERLDRTADSAGKIAAVLILILVIMHSIPAYAEQDGWLCTQCGADASGNFCSNCGASRESAAAPAEDSAAGDSEDAGVKEIIVFRYASQIIVVTVEKKPIMWIPNQVLNPSHTPNPQQPNQQDFQKQNRLRFHHQECRISIPNA